MQIAKSQRVARVISIPVSMAIVVTIFSPTWAQTRVQLAKGDSGLRYTARKVSSVDRQVAEQHPLWPALELAVDSYKHIRKHVRDYSCTVVRRERVNGRLMDHEYLTAKVRHQRSRNGKVVIPFGVYLKVLGPSKVKGREILYVDGQNDGDMLVKNGGKRFAFVTTKISPTSDTAMHGNRYPLTEFGIENLVKRLIENTKDEIALGIETKVRFFHDAKIDGRKCTGIEVSHPSYDPELMFQMARVFVDAELRVPVHYEAYGWSENGSEPELLEQYTYRDIRLNVGYTDRDFDPSNPNYGVQ